VAFKVSANVILSKRPQNFFWFTDSAVKYFITNLASTEKVGLEKAVLLDGCHQNLLNRATENS